MPRTRGFSKKSIRPGFPKFGIVRDVEHPRLLHVTCASCNNTFMVDELPFRGNSELKTRPCPYCFKTGALPE